LKLTLEWLKEFVDFSLSAQELADRLTMLGLEIEDFYQLPRTFKNIKIARVLSVVNHPEADHLKICEVDSGNQRLSVVCGAPNVKEGMLAPLAVDGSLIANDVKVTTRKVRGIESPGMLCSEAELGLSDRSEGLMVLPEDAKIGQDLHDYLGEPDWVFDIAVTANRPDCLSVIGIAREVASITGSKLKKPTVNIDDAELGSCSVKVEIQAPQYCNRYSGRLLQEIEIKPSPFWLAERLQAVGIRPINNVVDVTNYIMMETGQPLHAFDYRLLEGDKIIVRTAKDGERFTTLDGQEHVLDDEALLICDANKPVALAGIMGGLNSEVQPDTTSVFLESAYFQPTNIRMTSKKVELSTESSRRFERGIHPNGTLYALNRASELIMALAGGRPDGKAVDEYPVPIAPVEIDLKTQNTNDLLGTELENKDIQSLLESIELETSTVGPGEHRVTVPTFRPDLTREADLIEEISRLYGFDRIPIFTRTRIDQLQLPNERMLFRDNARVFLSSLGFKETVSINLSSQALSEYFLPKDQQILQLVNPISPDMSVFRPNLLLSLLSNVAYNRNRQIQNIRFFEIGQIAWRDSHNSIVEKTQIAGVLAGKKAEEQWYEKPKSFDFYDIKGKVEALLHRFGISGAVQNDAADIFWDYQSSSIFINDQFIGAFGKINEETCSLFKIKVPDVYGFYFDFDELYALRKTERTYKPIPRFPVSPFDLAIVVDENVPVSDVERVIKESGGALLKNVRLFDFYRGEPVPENKKSLGFSLIFSSNERTLSDEEVEKAVEQILEKLKEEIGAELRPR